MKKQPISLKYIYLETTVPFESHHSSRCHWSIPVLFGFLGLTLIILHFIASCPRLAAHLQQSGLDLYEDYTYLLQR